MYSKQGQIDLGAVYTAIVICSNLYVTQEYGDKKIDLFQSLRKVDYHGITL